MKLDTALVACGATLLLLAGWLVPNVMSYRAAASAAVAVPDARRAPAARIPAALLDVASVGLRTPVGTMTVPEDWVIRPPSFDSAYEIVDPAHGYPGQDGDGTVFVALHSSSSAVHAEAPGNTLVHDGRPTVQVGDVVTLRGEEFTVADVLVVGKNELTTTDLVWEQREGRLVLVTCVPRPGYASGVDNVVVIAERR